MVAQEDKFQIRGLPPVHHAQLIIIGPSHTEAVEQQVEFCERADGRGAVGKHLHIAMWLCAVTMPEMTPRSEQPSVAMALRSCMISGPSTVASSPALPSATRSATRPKFSRSAGRNTARRPTALPAGKQRKISVHTPAILCGQAWSVFGTTVAHIVSMDT